MATKTYSQIQSEISQLQAQAEQLREKEKGEVIGRIKEAITVYGITAKDLGLAARAPSAGGAAKTRPGRRRQDPAQAKFRDGAGNTWGGRGPRPQWLRDALASGKALSDFAT